MKNKTKDQLIEKHKLHLFKHNINITTYMQDKLVIYWIPKIHKNLVSFDFSKHLQYANEKHCKESKTSGLLRVAPQ